MNGFLGSAMLDTAIGTIFIYFLLATFCSAAAECVSMLVRARKEALHATLDDMLGGQTAPDGRAFRDALFSHPVVAAYLRRSRHAPFVPARAFSAAVLDLATPRTEGSLALNDFTTGVRALPAGPVRTTLLALLQDASDLPRARHNIEGWFQDSMRRASLCYRRRTRHWILFAAAAVTLAGNADTLRIVEQLRRPPAASTHMAEAPVPPDSLLGWRPGDLQDVKSRPFSHALGWLLTLMAVSLGAPFWFDLLNGALKLRRSEEEHSPQVQDRRT